MTVNSIPCDWEIHEDEHSGFIDVSMPISPHVVTERTLLFEPVEKDVLSYKHPKSRTGRLRKIFLNTPLEDEEQKWLVALRAHIKQEDLHFPAYLEKEYLRYLQHARGSVEATVKLLQANEIFKKEFMSSLKDTDILSNLQSGFMYWHGRDLNERPVLVVRTAKLCQKLKAGDIVRLVGFILEWMVKYGLIPGRVENWTVLVDLKDTSLTSISLETVKSLVTTLHMNYRFRNTKVVILKCPWIGTTIYKLISPLLPADTKEKVTFCSSVKEAQKLLVNIIDSRQLEEQFGGTAPNCEKPEDFYPYKFFPHAGNTSFRREVIPEAYQTSGRLWEDHEEAPETSRQWMKQCARNDFATASSCSYLRTKFPNHSIKPATNVEAHVKMLKTLFMPMKPLVKSASAADVERSVTEPCVTSQNTNGGRSYMERSAQLADAVIAKRGGPTQMPEELDKLQNATDQRTAVESEAELTALCSRIASMVNAGQISEAISLVKDHEDYAGKAIHDAITLNSMTGAYHLLELKHDTARSTCGTDIERDIESVGRGHSEVTTCNSASETKIVLDAIFPEPVYSETKSTPMMPEKSLSDVGNEDDSPPCFRRCCYPKTVGRKMTKDDASL